MAEEPTSGKPAAHTSFMRNLAMVFAFILVVVGMVNNLPTIPGLLETVKSILGLGNIPRISKFSSEFFFPIVFALMMVVVLMTTSFGKAWRKETPAKMLAGIGLDGLFFSCLSLKVIRR